MSPDAQEESETDNKQRSVWIEVEDGSEYDVSVIKEDEGWEAGSISDVIVETPIQRVDRETTKRLREVAVDVAQSIENINEENSNE